MNNKSQIISYLQNFCAVSNCRFVSIISGNNAQEMKEIIGAGVDIDEDSRKRKVKSFISNERVNESHRFVVRHLYDQGNVPIRIIFYKRASILGLGGSLTEENILEVLTRIQKFFLNETESRLSLVSDELSMAIQSARALSKGFAAEGTDGPFEVTLDFMLKTFGFEHGSIWELHDNGYLTLEAVRYCPLERYKHNIIHKSKGIVAEIFKPNAPRIEVLSDIDPRRLVNSQLADLYCGREIVMVRLGREAPHLGVAVLVNKSKKNSNITQLEYAAFDDFLTLELQAKRRTQQLELFTAIRQLIQSDKNTVSDLAQVICNKLLKIINCQGVSIFLRPEFSTTSNSLHLVASQHSNLMTPSEGFKEFQNGKEIRYLINNRSLTGKVAFMETPFLSNNVFEEQDNSNFYREIEDTSNTSWIGVPLLDASNSCIGVLRCTGKQTQLQDITMPYVFDSIDSDLLSTASAIITPVLMHAESSQRLKVVNENLKDSDQIREHEMRGPLQIIYDYANFVKNYLDDKGVTSKRRKLDAITTNVTLCSTLLTSTELPEEANKLIGVERVSLRSMLDNLVSVFRYNVEAKSKATLEVDVKSGQIIEEISPYMKVECFGTCPNIFVHKELIQRAFFNIGYNAIKYAKPGEFGRLTIRISYDSSNECCLVDFEDHGIGIPEDEKEKIFKERFRGRYAKNRQGKGLGLKIAKSIFAFHKGELELTRNSEPTCFRCRIPNLSKEEWRRI